MQLFLGRWICPSIPVLLLAVLAAPRPMLAQQTLGAITGTVLDASGAVVPDVDVRARNVATNFEVEAKSHGNGAYQIGSLPIGTYEVSFTKQGFETESHTQVLVSGDRTTTVNADLRIGAVSSTIEVNSTPLMNQVDTTNGYVVDQLTIQQTPLGTGSFTQLAILSPGVHADFLGGAGSNAGLGNQAIFANGQRDTSNSFSMNGMKFALHAVGSASDVLTDHDDRRWVTAMPVPGLRRHQSRRV